MQPPRHQRPEKPLQGLFYGLQHPILAKAVLNLHPHTEPESHVLTTNHVKLRCQRSPLIKPGVHPLQRGAIRSGIGWLNPIRLGQHQHRNHAWHWRTSLLRFETGQQFDAPQTHPRRFPSQLAVVAFGNGTIAVAEEIGDAPFCRFQGFGVFATGQGQGLQHFELTAQWAALPILGRYGGQGPRR